MEKETAETKIDKGVFQFEIGDLVKVSDPARNLISLNKPGAKYHDNLRVLFRFYDGDYVYVVEAEDGIGFAVGEPYIELVERPEYRESVPAPASPATDGRKIDEETYKALCRLGVLNTSVRSYNRGASDYSRHIIQPWTIWQDYNLNPWDADIVKRILRTKQGDSRRLDYEKIIHICEERIRQLDAED